MELKFKKISCTLQCHKPYNFTRIYMYIGENDSGNIMSTFYYIDYWGRKEIIEMWQLLDDAWPLIERGRSRVNKLMTSFRPSFFFFSFFSLVLHGCTYYSNASPICVISQDKCNDVTRWYKFVQNFDKKFHTLFRTAEKIFSVTKKILLIDEILLQLYSYELKY